MCGKFVSLIFNRLSLIKSSLLLIIKTIHSCSRENEISFEVASSSKWIIDAEFGKQTELNKMESISFDVCNGHQDWNLFLSLSSSFSNTDYSPKGFPYGKVFFKICWTSCHLQSIFRRLILKGVSNSKNSS